MDSLIDAQPALKDTYAESRMTSTFIIVVLIMVAFI